MSEADDTSVVEALTQGADFLIKLGSSLQKRAENVKEKKILSRENFTPQQALKIAEKLLLICELTNKSIDNVKSCLQDNLEVIMENNESLRTKRIQETDDKKKEEWALITTNSKTVKIPKRVNFKHYSSCSINIFRLSTSVLHNYLSVETKGAVSVDGNSHNALMLPNSTIEHELDKINNTSHNEISRSSDTRSSVDNSLDFNDKIVDDNMQEIPNKNIDAIKIALLDSDEDTSNVSGLKETKIDDIVSTETHSDSESTSENVNKLDENDKPTGKLKPILKCIKLNKLLKSDNVVPKVFKDEESNKRLAEAIHNCTTMNTVIPASIEAEIESPSKKIITISSSDEDLDKEYNAKKKSKKNVDLNGRVRNKNKEMSDTDMSDGDRSLLKKSNNSQLKGNSNRHMREVSVENINNQKKRKRTHNSSESSSSSEANTQKVKKKLKVRFSFHGLDRYKKKTVENSHSSVSEEESQSLADYSNKKQNLESEKENIEKKKALAEFKSKEFSITIAKIPQFTEEFLLENCIKRLIRNGHCILKLKDDENTTSDSSKSTSAKPRSSTKAKRKTVKKTMKVFDSSSDLSETDDEELKKVIKAIKDETEILLKKEKEQILDQINPKDAVDSTSDYNTSDEELREVLDEIKRELEEINDDNSNKTDINLRKVSISSSGTDEAIKKTVAGIERDLEAIISKDKQPVKDVSDDEFGFKGWC